MNNLDPLRFSRLRLFGKSAAHYQANAGGETAAMRKGTALHAYLLGQKDRIVVYEGGKRDERSKAWQEFKAEHADKDILIPSEASVAQAMRDSIERHPRALELLEGQQEQTIEWDLGGRRCKGTPDVARQFTDRIRLVELKSSRTAQPDLLKWHARKLAYHSQVDWYANGLGLTMSYPRLPVEEVFIIAVESAPPYPVTVLRVCESMREAGRKQWRAWFEQLRVCEATGQYPEYVQCDVDWEDEDRDVELDWEDDEAA